MDRVIARVVGPWDRSIRTQRIPPVSPVGVVGAVSPDSSRYPYCRCNDESGLVASTVGNLDGKRNGKIHSWSLLSRVAT